MIKRQEISMFKLMAIAIMLSLSMNYSVIAGPVNKEQNAASSKLVISKGFAEIVAPLMPAVVNISTVQKPKRAAKGSPFGEGSPFEELMPFFEKSFPPGTFDDDSMGGDRRLISLGSGFIIDSKGYIVTNYHVIAESSEIAVKLYNGTSLEAKIVGVDKATDIALLKIDSRKPLSFASFGDSDKARAGDWVIAIGNPFGLGNTVTSGIVSSNGRDISSEGVVDNFIQTDAAINRGNSGGPMFNIDGEVIGMNTQILSPSGVNIGIGFATPSSIIGPVIKQLRTTGEVISGYLGVTMQILTDDLAESMGMENNKGALVIEVTKSTPASKAGIVVGDVITSFDGKDVKSTKELQRLVRNSPIGKPLSMVVLRHKTKKELVVTLEKASTGGGGPGLMEKFSNKLKDLSQFSSYKKILGASISPLNADLRNKFGIDSNVNGLILLEIAKKSPWYFQDFAVGDVLLLVNGQPLTSVDQLEKAVKDSKDSGKKSIFFLVQKKGMRRFMSLPLDEKKY